MRIKKMESWNQEVCVNRGLLFESLGRSTASSALSTGGMGHSQQKATAPWKWGQQETNQAILHKGMTGFLMCH